jgi:uncharacterized membrane protein YbhN (UPF0104 family)
MTNLLTLKYWFDVRPESFIPLARNLFVAFLVLLLVAGIVFMIYRKKSGKNKILFNKLYDFCFINLVLGFLLLFFNVQQIQFFSARFWLLVWLAVMIVWVINISKRIKKIVSHREERRKEEEFKKYLP